MDPLSVVIDKIQEWMLSEESPLPVYNTVGLELHQAISREDFDIKDCAALILRDQTLAGQTLREANSAAYGRLTPITTIEDAIVLLGADEVIRLTMLVAQRDLYKCSHPQLKPAMEKIWLHALGVATGTAWLARRTGYGDQAREMFLAGLLHDIGQLMVVRALDDLFDKEELEDITNHVLMAAIDALHVSVGHQLAKHWNLPEVFCDVICGHHIIQTHNPQTANLLVQITDHVCAKLGISLYAYAASLPVEKLPAVESLGISPEILEGLEITLAEKFGTVPSMKEQIAS